MGKFSSEFLLPMTDHVGKLSRNSVTEFQILAWHVGLRDCLIVNNEAVSIASAVVCTTSNNLIAADGSDSGASPSAVSTLYYAYISNLQAPVPGVLRLSATAPTNGYLGAGNAAHYRFVGTVYLDVSLQIAFDWNICGYGIEHFIKTVAQIVRTSGVAAYYEFEKFENFVGLENSILYLVSNFSQLTADTSRLYVQYTEDGTAVTYTTWPSTTQFWTPVPRISKFGSIQEKTFACNYYYAGVGTLTIGYTTAAYNTFEIIRLTL